MGRGGFLGLLCGLVAFSAVWFTAFAQSGSSTMSPEILFGDIVPRGSLFMISSVDSNMFDVVRSSEDLLALAKNLKNIRGSVTSLASSALSLQAVLGDLVALHDVMEEIRGLEGVRLTDEFHTMQEAVETAIIHASVVGELMQAMLIHESGTTGMLVEIQRRVQSMGEAIGQLEQIRHFDVSSAADSFTSFTVDPRSFLLDHTAGTLLDANLDLLGGAKFKLFNDLTASGLSRGDLTVGSIVSALRVKGGFRLPSDFGFATVGLSNDFRTIQAILRKRGIIVGSIQDGIHIGTQVNVPDVLDSALSVTSDLAADGNLNLKRGAGQGIFESDFDIRKDINIPGLADASVGLGDRNVLTAKLDLKDREGSLVNSNSLGGGVSIGSDKVNGGSGFGGTSDLKIGIDGLAGGLNLENQFGSGGGLTLGEVLNGGGGLNSDGRLDLNTNLKDLTANAALSNDIGFGGVANLGQNSVLAGGAGGVLDLTGGVDAKQGKANVDLYSKTGTDASIKLPGKLGGLSYDITDVTDISGHIDLKDLSNRGLEILKQTDILATVDLPGDRLDDITIEAHPSLNLNKLGNLNVLGFARKFAQDLSGITEFNMLTSENIQKALSSGKEFLERLNILDALSNEIGAIAGLGGVRSQVAAILNDMAIIREALARVQTFASKVRLLGKALENFDIGDLKVELDQLEAQSIGSVGDGISGFSAEVGGTVNAAVEDAIPMAANALSQFSIGEFMDAATIAEKISTAALDNIANVHRLSADGLSEIIRDGALSAMSNPAGFGAVLSSVPGLADGLEQVVTVPGQLDDVVNNANAVVGSVTGGAIDLNGLNLNDIVRVANLQNLNLNDVANLEQIADLAGLEDLGALETIITVANLRDIDLNTISDTAVARNLNLQNIADLSKVLNFDLTDVARLNQVVKLADLDLSGVDLARVVAVATQNGLDINNLNDFTAIAQLEELSSLLDNDQLTTVREIVEAANLNNFDLSMLPKLQQLPEVNLNDISEVAKLVSDADLAKALSGVDVTKLGRLINLGSAGSTAGDIVSRIAVGEVVGGGGGGGGPSSSSSSPSKAPKKNTGTIGGVVTGFLKKVEQQGVRRLKGNLRRR